MDEKNRQEYRFEVVGIGQGHYVQTLADAINGAVRLSKDFRDDIIKLEQFKPIRMPIMTFKNGSALQAYPTEEMVETERVWRSA
jgi:hypothetical protein